MSKEPKKKTRAFLKLTDGPLITDPPVSRNAHSTSVIKSGHAQARVDVNITKPKPGRWLPDPPRSVPGHPSQQETLYKDTHPNAPE